MRGITHVQNSGDQLIDGGLMSLLTGDAKESFSSMLGAVETEHQQPNDRDLPEERRGGQNARSFGAIRGEHLPKGRPSEHHGSSRSNGQKEASAMTAASQGKISSARSFWTENSREQSGYEPESHGRESNTPTAVASAVDGGSTGAARIHVRSGVPTGNKAEDIGNASDTRRTDHSDVAREAQSPPQVIPTQTSAAGNVEGLAKLEGGSDAGVQGDGMAAGGNGAQELATVKTEVQRGANSNLVTVGGVGGGECVPPPLFDATGSSATSSSSAASGVIRGPQITRASEGQGRAANQQGGREAPGHHDASAGTARDARTTTVSVQPPVGAGAGITAVERITAAHRTPVQSNRGESPRPGVSDLSPREAGIDHVTDAGAIRMLANETRRELQVGVHTEAFGRVTIQTSGAAGQMSAQVSLEDSKQSAVLAAHLPLAEQRITQLHGLEVSVRMSGGSHAGSGNASAGNGRQAADKERHQTREHNGQIPTGRGMSQIGSSTNNEGVHAPRHLLPGRLDVTA